MSSDARLEKTAITASEEILQRIYGDDYTGCTVSIDEITSIVQAKYLEHAQEERSILELYEKAIEGIRLLATPPEPGSTLTPEELQTLLSERLDTIHTLTTKIIGTLEAVKAKKTED